jgi:SAM-dependent methyltransferase
LWIKTGGSVGEVVGLDCAAANADAYARLRNELSPAPGDRVRFVCHDFSSGLARFPNARFDGVVSGLSISYAEAFDDATGKWTTAAYDRLLSDVYRVLTPGGRFVFSVNVPEPSWGIVGLYSLPALLRSEKPLRALKRSWRMLRYGRWLKREARIGRFHYLPAEDVTRKLSQAGFTDVSHILSYRKQAYVFQATKPA